MLAASKTLASQSGFVAFVPQPLEDDASEAGHAFLGGCATRDSKPFTAVSVRQGCPAATKRLEARVTQRSAVVGGIGPARRAVAQS